MAIGITHKYRFAYFNKNICVCKKKGCMSNGIHTYIRKKEDGELSGISCPTLNKDDLLKVIGIIYIPIQHLLR